MRVEIPPDKPKIVPGGEELRGERGEGKRMRNKQNEYFEELLTVVREHTENRDLSENANRTCED